MNKYIIGCFRNNKLVMTIEVNMTEETFRKYINQGVINYMSTNGAEYIYLNNFDKIVISGDVFIGD